MRRFSGYLRNETSSRSQETSSFLKEDFKISCYDMCSSLLSLIKDIEGQPQPTKRADHASSGRLITRGQKQSGMKFL